MSGDVTTGPDPSDPSGASGGSGASAVSGVSGPGRPGGTEPAYPSRARAEFRRAWLVGWLLVAVALTTALGFAWVADAGVEVLAVLGALAATAVSVALHHVVVTRDSGELAVERGATGGDVGDVVTRRGVVVAAVGTLVVAVLGFVGIRRVGDPLPRDTAWADGVALVTVEGRHLRADDVPVGGVVTAWPQGAAGTERTAVMVLRLHEDALAPTRLDGVVDGTLVAYSRLCTHAGCAVALFRDRDHALFCPCHQATFDARRAATPTAGPASAPLPQLPLRVDGDGGLVAAGDLTARPGPVSGTVRS